MSLTNSPTPQSVPVTHLWHGKRLPFFFAGGPPASDPRNINPFVSAMNAALNLKVERTPAIPQADGSTVASARVIASDLEIKIILFDQ